MMTTKKADQDAELLKDFFSAIERREKKLIGSNSTKFMAGYLESFLQMNMTPKLRREILSRVNYINTQC